MAGGTPSRQAAATAEDRLNTAPILQVGHPVLRARAAPIERDTLLSPRIQNLIEVMRETMRAAPGVGLAAPQIGESLQLVVIEDHPERLDIKPQVLEMMQRRTVPFHVLVNPLMRIDTTEEHIFFEGCLSMSGFRALVARAAHVRVDALDHAGQPVSIEATGWYDRILQHECDHLQGTLYIDRMESRSLTGAEMFVQHWDGQPPARIMETLGIRRPSPRAHRTHPPPPPDPRLRTSESHPLRVDIIPECGPGWVGMCMAPGKTETTVAHLYRRNLGQDLERLQGEFNVQTVLTLLQPHEFSRLGISNLLDSYRTRGMEVLHHPIPDGGIPSDMAAFAAVVQQVAEAIRGGRRVLIHCNHGQGRTGTVAAALLVALGHTPEAAMEAVRRARPGTINRGLQEGFVRDFAAYTGDQGPK